jgi:predicted CoA-binding protein
MQLGLKSEALAAIGESAGLTVIQDKCIKIELENIKAW